MDKTDYMNNSDYKSFLRIVYAICIFFVLYLIFGAFQKGAFSGTSHDDPRLMSYEEMKGCENNLQIPHEWRFLADQNDRQKRNPPLFSLRTEAERLESQRRFTEDVTNLAESLRERNEAISREPVSPLLKLGVMRKHPNQTYEPEDLQALSELQETSVQNTNQDTLIHQSLGKPVGLEAEPFPKESEVPTIEEIPSDLENGSSLSPLSQQCSVQVNPRLQHKVRISQKGQDPAEELLKYLDGDSEETANPEPVVLKNQEESKQQYNHKEGMEILRKFNLLAKNRLESYSRDVHDYALLLYKWDTTSIRSDGMDVMYVKLREKPYSFYAFSIFPKRSEGREMLYWDGHYDNRLVVNSGPKLWNRTLLLRPDSSAVQSHSTRSVLHLGFRELLQELIDISDKAESFRNAEIRYYDQAKVGERSCYTLEVTFPEKTPEQTFYQIRIFVDRELTLPIQIVMYDWPEKGKAPKVLESYTYVIQKMNEGFQDRDFCHLNPQYGFNSYIPDLSEGEKDFMKGIIPPEELREKKN